MFRALCSGVRLLTISKRLPATIPVWRPNYFSTLINNKVPTLIAQAPKLTKNPEIITLASNIGQVRTVTKFSLKKGKRRTVKAVPEKFFRLHWGGWIRTKCGRHKKMWKKSTNRKKRLQEHVFCNATQCKLLDKMVTKFWKRPKYYVDDPYAPYHTRDEFIHTRKKPIVYE